MSIGVLVVLNGASSAGKATTVDTPLPLLDPACAHTRL